MKSASLSQKAYALLMFLAVSMLSGLLLAGLAVPFTALAGGTTKAVATSLQDLPAEFQTPAQPERSRVLMANGKVLATFFDENRIYVSLDKISPIMQQAQIAIEDHRFYEHGAIDPQGIGRAFFKNAMGDTQGASTLTQQYVKLVQVEIANAKGDEAGVAAATEVSIERKIREMRYAMAVEEKLTKDQILERYLNIAYYGAGAYGVEAAAHRYFATSAAQLTLPQAAMLAGIVQNPEQFNPLKYPERALERRDVVLNQMVKWGTIPKADADKAKKVGLDPTKVRKTYNGCKASEFPHLCEYVRRTLISDKFPALGKTPEQRENLLKRGGLTIQTLIDPDAQRAAEAAVSKVVSPIDAALGGSVLIQPKSGLIVAMAQSRPRMGDGPGETWYNINVEKAMGGAEGYQAGSTFKIFGMSAALEAGATPSKSYNSPGALSLKGMKFKSCDGPFKFNQSYTGHNLGERGYGTITMVKAAMSSVNTYFLQLVRDVGICATIDSAKRAGVKMASGKNLESESWFPTFILGTTEITPLSLAEAYATYANRGKHCDPIIIQTVATKSGKKLQVPGNCAQTIPQGAADGVNHILSKVMTPGGTGYRVRIPDGRAQAGKTGTTSSNEAVWFAGYTPELAGVSFIAVDKTHPHWKNHRRTLKGYRLATGVRLEGTGSGDAGLIWTPAMGTALAKLPKTQFAKPGEQVMEGQKVEVPDVSGMSYSEAKETLEAAGFDTVRWGVYSSRREGAFLGASPSGQATKFSTISLRVSIGPKPRPTSRPKRPAVASKPVRNSAPQSPAAPATPAPKPPEPAQPKPPEPAKPPAPPATPGKKN